MYTWMNQWKINSITLHAIKWKALYCFYYGGKEWNCFHRIIYTMLCYAMLCCAVLCIEIVIWRCYLKKKNVADFNDQIKAATKMFILCDTHCAMLKKDENIEKVFQLFVFDGNNSGIIKLIKGIKRRKRHKVSEIAHILREKK